MDIAQEGKVFVVSKWYVYMHIFMGHTLRRNCDYKAVSEEMPELVFSKLFHELAS